MAMHASETYGESRSPIREHFQNRPANLDFNHRASKERKTYQLRSDVCKEGAGDRIEREATKLDERRGSRCELSRAHRPSVPPSLASRQVAPSSRSRRTTIGAHTSPSD